MAPIMVPLGRWELRGYLGDDWAWRDGMHTINAAGDVVVVDGLRVERW